MFKLKVVVSFLSLLIAVPSALAANREVKERTAKRACLNGDPLRGVQILTDLYIDTNDPTYIYNQGRCFEQNNRYEEAIGRFREYLRKTTGTTDVDKADAKGALKHIADCESLLGRKVADPNQPAVPETPPPPQPQPAAPPPPKPPQPIATIPLAAPPASSAPAGGGLRAAGIVTMAVGGAALVAGLVLNFKANSMVNDAQNRFDGGTYSSSKDYKTVSQVGYGAGAVCLAGGALLYYLGVRAGHGVAAAPNVGQGTAGAILTGAF